MLDGGLTNTINTVVRLVFLFWQGLRQDVQAKQQALHRLQQAQEVRRVQSAAQKDIVQHKEEEQVREICIYCTCWLYSWCTFQYRQQYETTGPYNFDC